jgi:hypothetical protein
MKTKSEIKERIIELNWLLLRAFDQDDKRTIMKVRLETDSLIKLYLKEEVGTEVQ